LKKDSKKTANPQKKNPQNFQKRQHLRSKDGKPASPDLNSISWRIITYRKLLQIAKYSKKLAYFIDRAKNNFI
jgi:hypothetical protein